MPAVLGAGCGVGPRGARDPSRARDGDEWVVTGQKVWTSLGHKASFGLLLARTDIDAPKNRGLTTFLISLKAPGVDVRPLRQMTGDAEFNEVYLTEVRLPADAQLGLVGKGWQVATTTLMNERVLDRERDGDDGDTGGQGASSSTADAAARPGIARSRRRACGSSRSSAGS